MNYKIELETDSESAQLIVQAFGIKMAEAIMVQAPGAEVHLTISGDNMESIHANSTSSDEEWDL